MNVNQILTPNLACANNNNILLHIISDDCELMIEYHTESLPNSLIILYLLA